MRKQFFLFFLLLIFTKWTTAQKYDGLALTPPMGWNSWNTFQVNISEQLIKETADMIVSSGMKDAGYTYLVIDDGWMSKQRDSVTGDLVPDPQKFPNGLKPVIEYVHSKGLKFGIYNCAGTLTCAGYPGTRGYEYQDARYYASIGVDYLKFDWCNSEGINAKEAYTTMSKALKATKRPIVFSLCEWGTNKPWEWAAPAGHLWRTTGDISPIFAGVHNYGTWSAQGVLKIIDFNKNLRQYAGPGHWNDPDMLEVGNGMTANEDRAHFTMWCMMAAPLMAGNDLRKMSNETLTTLTSKDVISIDQDPLGIQGFNYNSIDSVDTWFKPLQNDEWAVCFLNKGLTPQKIQFDWKAENVKDTLFKKELNASMVTYRISDLWNKKEAGNTIKPFTVIVPAHDVILLLLKPVKK